VSERDNPSAFHDRNPGRRFPVVTYLLILLNCAVYFFGPSLSHDGLPADAPALCREDAFVQHYDTDVLDASVLLMPLTKFMAPRDPRWLSTLDAIGEELVSDSLVYRYNIEASPDGLEGEEGTFSICTFWYVEALARAGKLDEARLAFEKMLTYANHLGLYSEQIGATGELLGNFPQAFTHLALISAAVNLDRELGP